MAAGTVGEKEVAAEEAMVVSLAVQVVATAATARWVALAVRVAHLEAVRGTAHTRRGRH